MQSFRLGLVTWNVGGAQGGIVSGTSSLLREASHCDVIVVGLQEVALGRRGWKAELRKGLGSNWAYVGGESYAGMRVKVFARLSNLPVPNLQFTTLSAQETARVGLNVRAGRYPVVGVTGSGKRVGAGVADRWPNKGAVAVEIRFGAGCRVVFVVAHLAANEERIQGREDDWRAILRRLDRVDIPLTRGTDPVITVPLFHRYEHVFVLGDLNYRIAPPGTDHQERVRWVQQLVEKKDWCSLVDADQLMKEIIGDKVFANFQEAEIRFPPTFKIDPKTGMYSSARIPSYCDRILWHSLPARIDLVRCVQYRSLIGFKQSDHIPVYGEYELRVPVVVKPVRSLNALQGHRVVLEFMLVRYVKCKGHFPKRRANTDGPLSMRHIKEPATLNLPLVLTMDDEGDSSGNFLDEPADEDYDDDDVELDEDEAGDEDDTSSISSEEDEDYGQNFEDGNDVDWSMYAGPDISVHAELEEPLFIAPPPTPGQATRSSGRSNSAGLDGAFRKLSTGSSGDLLTYLSQSEGDVKQSHLPDSSAEFAAADDSTPKESPRPVAHVNSGTRKRDSLSRQVDDSGQQAHGSKKSKKRSRLNGMRMEVHGQGLFLKQGRVYRVSIPKRENGSRERIGESLPVIPFAPISSLSDLEYRHVLIEFARKKSRVGTSGALPLRELLPHVGELYAFELSLTKYGQPVGTLEACVQLTLSDSQYWEDAKGRIVRNSDGGPNKLYRGPLPVRKRTRAKTKAEKRAIGV